LNPILNVSNLQESFAWFAELGWTKGWEWGDPPNFGGVCSGECEIFLCQGAQGGRGKGPLTGTFGVEGGETADKGVWMSIWVDDVDAVHRRCLAQSLDVTWPPTDMPWNAREMHVRHPDGHVFRITQSLERPAQPLSAACAEKPDRHAVTNRSDGRTLLASRWRQASYVPGCADTLAFLLGRPSGGLSSALNTACLRVFGASYTQRLDRRPRVQSCR
jgi:hypothetical protein